MKLRTICERRRTVGLYCLILINHGFGGFQVSEFMTLIVQTINQERLYNFAIIREFFQETPMRCCLPTFLLPIIHGTMREEVENHKCSGIVRDSNQHIRICVILCKRNDGLLSDRWVDEK